MRLSAPGNLEAALADAGLRLVDSGEVVCHWRYASSWTTLVRGLLCSAGGARAVQAAGEHAVRDVLQRALAQFQDPQTRVVTMREHVPLGRRLPVTPASPQGPPTALARAIAAYTGRAWLRPAGRHGLPVHLSRPLPTGSPPGMSAPRGKIIKDFGPNEVGACRPAATTGSGTMPRGVHLRPV